LMPARAWANSGEAEDSKKNKQSARQAGANARTHCDKRRGKTCITSLNELLEGGLG
jgi:hypothetical protein